MSQQNYWYNVQTPAYLFKQASMSSHMFFLNHFEINESAPITKLSQKGQYIVQDNGTLKDNA